MSIEPSLEDVKRIILHYGFVFEVTVECKQYSFFSVSFMLTWTSSMIRLSHRRKEQLRRHTQQILNQ